MIFDCWIEESALQRFSLNNQKSKIHNSLLRRPSRKRQQGNVASLLDGGGKTTLVRSANSRQPAWHDFAAFGHELGQQPNVLVVDSLNLFDAKLADLLTPEILATAFAPSARSTRTRSAAIATAVRAIGTIWTLGPLCTSRPLLGGSCCSGFVSHDAP
jgi:hypothetical protein